MQSLNIHPSVWTFLVSLPWSEDAMLLEQIGQPRPTRGRYLLDPLADACTRMADLLSLTELARPATIRLVALQNLANGIKQAYDHPCHAALFLGGIDHRLSVWVTLACCKELERIAEHDRHLLVGMNDTIEQWVIHRNIPPNHPYPGRDHFRTPTVHTAIQMFRLIKATEPQHISAISSRIVSFVKFDLLSDDNRDALNEYLINVIADAIVTYPTLHGSSG